MAIKDPRVTTIYSLYFKPLSFLFWINRGVYLGIIASALYFHDKFWGEFNLLHSVDERLVFLALAGWLFYEAGAWSGWTKRARRWRLTGINWLKSVNLATPLVIWFIAVLLSIALFYLQGVPLLTDPLTRANIGPGWGMLKRFMVVFLPVATIEFYAFHLKQKRYALLSATLIIVTLAILFLLTFKAKLFFFVIYLFLAYYILRLCKYRNWLGKVLNPHSLLLLLLFVTVIYLYAKFALDYSFLAAMVVRVTNLITHSPNYIVSGLPGVPARSEVLLNDLAGIMRTFRIPTSLAVRQIDTELTRVILGRYVAAGGLNLTVIGYGWIVGGWTGVLILSFLYGYLSGIFVKGAANTGMPMAISVFMFAAYAVYGGLQINSPVGAFLDNGLSLIGYVALHRFLDAFLTPIARSTKPRRQSADVSHTRI